MNRKTFVKNCGMSCLGLLVAPAILQGCAGTKYIAAPIVGSDMIVPLSAFEVIKEAGIQYRQYLVVQNDSLQFPICVYRISPETYHALWMKCTHQGTELHVFGNKLQCPAHGSEFSNAGTVQNGPASENLKTFAVVLEGTSLKIDLR